MKIDLDILLDSASPPPPEGAEVIIRLRDVGQLDAPAVLLAECKTKAHPVPGNSAIARAIIDWPGGSRHAALSVLVDVDGDGRTSRGDYVTTQHYTAPSEPESHMQVIVKRV